MYTPFSLFRKLDTARGKLQDAQKMLSQAGLVMVHAHTYVNMHSLFIDHMCVTCACCDSVDGYVVLCAVMLACLCRMTAA